MVNPIISNTSANKFTNLSTKNLGKCLIMYDDIASAPKGNESQRRGRR